tara:strand:- start:3507 stop:3695 length:189 start_codon:yes stop_codon:yes gene_type:complete
MIESLRKIGMIEMPKIKHTAKRSIDELARIEAMRLLKRGDKVNDAVSFLNSLPIKLAVGATL